MGLGPETKNLAGMGLHVDLGRHHHRSVHVLPESIAVHRIGDLDFCLHPWAQLGCLEHPLSIEESLGGGGFFTLERKAVRRAETDKLQLREKS